MNQLALHLRPSPAAPPPPAPSCGEAVIKGPSWYRREQERRGLERCKLCGGYFKGRRGLTIHRRRCEALLRAALSRVL